MGKIVVTQFMSLDGVIEDPGGAEDYEHGGWVFKFDRGDEGNSSSSTRRWRPTRCCSDGHLRGLRGRLARARGRLRGQVQRDAQHVVSTTLSDPDWSNTEVVSERHPGRGRRAARPLRGRHPDQRERDLIKELNGTASSTSTG